MKTPLRCLLAAVLAFAALPAAAQSTDPSPGGANVPRATAGCLNSSGQAVPWFDASGTWKCAGATLPVGGSITATAPVGIIPTDRTIASATGSSQTVMAANAARHSLLIVNTGNANCGINPTGGTAAIGGAGTLTLAPLGSYSPRIPSLSAVTVICTAAQPLYADEN